MYRNTGNSRSNQQQADDYQFSTQRYQPPQQQQPQQYSHMPPPPPSQQQQYRTQPQNSFHPQARSTHSPIPNAQMGSTSPMRSSFASIGRDSFPGGSGTPGSPSQASAHSNPEQQHKQVGDKVTADCYSKTIQSNGQRVHEVSYIAHISVQEFPPYSSQPPPPNVNPGPPKNRILVLCKKYSGRMLLQKGKFSDDGRFQVGRTWDLSELSLVRKAGLDGMVLRITKDYYWKSDEDDSRIWKFCRYLCQYYGIATGRYPNMVGFSVDEFMLPAVPKSPTQAASPTFQSFAKHDPLPTQQRAASPKQEPATKSLRQKIMHKPSLFSQDKSSHHEKQVSGNQTSPTNRTSPSHKKTLSGGMYNGLDFTVNGQLPKKPMQVMQRETPPVDYSRNNEPSRHQLGQPFSQSQSTLASSTKASSYQQEADSRQQSFSQMANRSDTTSQTLGNDQSYYSTHLNASHMADSPPKDVAAEAHHKSHPYAQKIGNEDSRSVMSGDSHSFVFGGNDIRDNRQHQSTKGTDQSTSPYRGKKPAQQGAVKSMLEPLESVKEHSKPDLHANEHKEYEQHPSVEQMKDRKGSSSSISNSVKKSIMNDSRERLAKVSSQKRPSSSGSGTVHDHQRNRSQGSSSWNLNEKNRDVNDKFGNKDIALSNESKPELPHATSSFIEESTKLEGSNKVDEHMKELEGMLDSHITGAHDDSFNFNDGVDLNDEPERNVVPQAEAPPVDTIDSTLDDDTHSILGEPFEPGLNISKKTPTPSAPDISHTRTSLPEFERDLEAEELLKDLNWSSSMDADTLVKSLTRELNKTKQETVKKLVDIDLSNTNANDVGAASSEVEHMIRIFQKMDINFKMLNADVSVIDKNSKGLQLKFVNKKLLYDGLNGILSKVSVGADDLHDIGEFKNFGLVSAIGGLESKLLSLYNGLITIRSDSSHANDGEDLSSLKALQQYRSKYESVSARFVKHFYEFMKNRIDSIGKELLKDVESVDPKSITQRLSQLLVYSGITYYLKEIGREYFDEINNRFNNMFSKLLVKILKAKLTKLKADQVHSRPALSASHYDSLTHVSSIGRKRSERKSASPSLRNGLDDEKDDDDDDDEDFAPLRKGRSSRFARKGSSRANQSINNRELDSEKQEQLESIKRHVIGKGTSSGELEDYKSVIGLIDEAKTIVMIFQFFIVLFFHYDAATLDFAEYLDTKPFESRKEFADPNYFVGLDFTDISNNYSVSNDVIENLDKVLGGFITTFIKIVNPIDINIPVILLHMEDLMKSIQESVINQDFLIYNFLQLVSDKYQNQWRKFVDSQTESIKNSTIIPNSGILSSVKQVNYIFLITEMSIGSRDIKGTKVRGIIDKAYVQLTDALISLFSRQDPLVNSGGFDDKEREYKNVAILENIFYILQQLNDIGASNNSSTKKLSEKLTQNFKRIEDLYFAKQVHKSIGKLVVFIEDCEKTASIASTHHQVNPGDSIKRQHHLHQQRKLAKSLLAQFSEDDIKYKAESIHETFEKQFRKTYDQSTGGGRSGNDNLFTHDLIDKLWNDMEIVFIDYFTRLGKILRSQFDREMDYHVGRQDIHHIFKSIRS
ncbi:SEC3 [Candida metapsilosis]|uniref:SEC3 n=1 Tax=Candida metapsilosis TaxID=273372 RepID=A0A8H7ZDZ7_9ASCO|nr:SEC3 [Candida metapsilosis]